VCNEYLRCSDQTNMNKKPSFLFVELMQLSIPYEKGTVEEIIWQTDKRLKAITQYIFNLVKRNILGMTLKPTVL